MGQTLNGIMDVLSIWKSNGFLERSTIPVEKQLLLWNVPRPFGHLQKL